MAGSMKVFECYIKWKKQGLKRRLSQELADEAGVSLQTLYKWAKKPITINTVEYANWEEAYRGENKEVLENYIKEINEQIEEDYRLSDVLANEILMKYILKVKMENYVPTLEELKLAIQIQERKRDLINGENNSKIDTIQTEIGFR